MEHATPEEYISNIITEDNINKSIDHLMEALTSEMYDASVTKSELQLYIDWSQHHLRYAADTCEKNKSSLATLQKNIKFYKEKLRVYEKSLWSISEDDANWLMQLEEKNQRIDMLKSELFRYGKANEDCELIGDVDDFHFAFYLDSITRLILEVELQMETMKDIKKSMEDQMGNSTEIPQKILKNKGNENDESDESRNKKKDEPEGWNDLLCYLVRSIRKVDIPVAYWLNRLNRQKLKSESLIRIENVLTKIIGETNERELQNHLRDLKVFIECYANTRQIHFFTTCYKNSRDENSRLYLILRKQLQILNDIIAKFIDEAPKSVETLNEQNNRVSVLKDQYAMLTKKLSKYTQDQVADVNENLIKCRTEVDAVRNKYEKLMEKHENECKIVMAEKYAGTLDAEKREYPIKVEEQQKEELSDERKKNDEKKINDEMEVQCFKDDQRNKRNQELERKKDQELQDLQNYCIWQIKCTNIITAEQIEELEMRYKLHKNMLNKLMQSGNIDEMIATHQEKMKNNSLKDEIGQFFINKLALYCDIEQADYIQAATKHTNRGYDHLFRENVSSKGIFTLYANLDLESCF